MPPADPEQSSYESDAAAPEAPLEAHPGATSLSNSGDTCANLRAKQKAAESHEAAHWIGRRLARYQITQVLGTGGMGVVYLAHDTLIERDVAIKMLSRSLASDERVLKRFLIEAKAAGKLNHANAVAIYEIGQEGDAHYLVMEYVSGGSVEARLETEGAYSVLEATRIAADACRGLAAAHRAGIVHRDIKPGNLLVTADCSVKVADFGLAKNSFSRGEQVTQSGQVVGTPYFMSPEQCQADSVDHRGDIYSLGATYYTLLTGTNPYVNAGSIVQIMFSHCHADIPDPRAINEEIPAACASIIARAMAKQPEDRYQSAEAMLADLLAVTGSTPVSTILGTGKTEPATEPAALELAPKTISQEQISRGQISQGQISRRQFVVTGGGLAAVFLAGAALTLFWKSGPSPNGPDGNRLRQGAPGNAGAGVLPAGRPLRVGILHSLSGTLASSESPVVDATLLAIEEINQAGGLLGRPVEAVIRDGHSDEAVFAAEAERLITREQVATVFGCWSSSCRKTVKPIFEERDHLLIYPVQYEGIEESPNVFYLGAAPNQQIIPAVNWAFTVKGKKRFFLVGSDYVFPRTANAIIRDTLRELGAEAVGEDYLALGESDAKALVARIASAGPDVILNTINGDSNLSFFKELRRAGITPETVPTISFSIGEAEMRNLNLSHMAGDFAAWNYFQSLTCAENRAFVGKFQAKYGRQRVLTDPMEAAYVGVKLWGAAVAEARSDKPVDIRRALQNRRWQAPEGEVRIDPTTQHAFKTPRIGKITAEGQFEVVWTAAKPEPPRPYPSTRTAEEWKAFLNDLYNGWGNRWAAPAE